MCLQVTQQAAPGVGFFKLPAEGDQIIEGSMFAGSAYVRCTRGALLPAHERRCEEPHCVPCMLRPACFGWTR